MLDKKQIESIKNYADEIVTLESFFEAVRLRPGMYIGSIGAKGFLSMIREIFQNSLDEMMKASSPCNKVWVYYNEITNEVTVMDNGRGIPFGEIERIFSSQHTSSNYTKKKGEYSSGLHGVGSKVTNALSSIFIVKSFILGEGREFQFIDGKPWDKGELVIKKKDCPIQQGTIVYFRPCTDIMGEIQLPSGAVYEMIQNILMLTSLGSRVYFEALKSDGTVYKEEMVNEDGLLRDIINKTVNPLFKPIPIQFDNGENKVDLLFTYDSENFHEEKITAFANFCPTVAGTHIDGMIDGIVTYFKDYMNKIFLKNSKLSVINTDIKCGLIGIIHISCLNPIFDGQSKETLANQEVYPFVKNLIVNSLNEWSKANPGDLQKICRYLKDIAEVRVKQDESKIKISNKYKSDALSGGLPAKYAKPKINKDIEFFIVEGDSAAGSIKNIRTSNQGLYQIRGKVPNAFTTNKKDFLENEEISGIISIIGAGYGKKFDITKTNVSKVIFATDADADGAHIRSLLLKLFLLYMRPMIEDGRIYTAVPPLYGLKLNKNNMKYFITMIDYIKYTEKEFSKNNTLTTIDGKVLNTNDIIDILYNNADYYADLYNMSNRYALNPYLVEMVLCNLDKDFKSLDKIIKSNFRFMKYNQIINKVPVFKGLINQQSQTLILNEQFLNDFKFIIEQIRKNKYMYFNVNGSVKSLYGVMELYTKQNNSANNITRYKGLGEMNPIQLEESTTNPSNRTLIRYNIEDVEKEIEAMQAMENNKFSIIENINITKRDIF